MTVDPELRALLDAFDDGSRFDLARARAALDDLSVKIAAPGPAADAQDTLVAGVPVRAYTPPTDGPGLPLVWLHGGGFVTGSLDAMDPFCRQLLARAGAPVTSVDYRLAPEHPFPAALEDCTAVLRARAGAGPVVVGGDSAGGALAVAACVALRDEGLPVTGQLLVTPLTDCTLSSASIRDFGTGFGLTRQALEVMVEHYLQGADPRDPRCSPLLTPDLSGLPPAVVATAEFDPLRDDGEAYAAALNRAGVPVTARRFDAMVHGFTGMSTLTPVADQALDWAFAALAELVAG